MNKYVGEIKQLFLYYIKNVTNELYNAEHNFIQMKVNCAVAECT